MAAKIYFLQTCNGMNTKASKNSLDVNSPPKNSCSIKKFNYHNIVYNHEFLNSIV